MKAVVCEKPFRFSLIDKEEPKPRDGEAIVRIKRIGVCGTDLHAFQGNQPYFKYPRILGHEFSGEIEYIGENKKGLKKGDRVTIFPYISCGSCIACRNNKPNCCINLEIYGIHIDGGMQELLNIPYEYLIKSDSLTLDELALVECLSIGAHANRRANVCEKDLVLVIGTGPIGIGIMYFAKIRGASIIAMDVSKKRLDFVKRNVNPDFLINAMDGPLEKLKKITGNDLPTVVFDATGNRKSMESSLYYMANGGRLIFVSLVNSEINFYDPDFHKKETTLLSSRNATIEDFTTVINALERKLIDVKPCITHRANFDDVMHKFPKWIKPNSGIIKAIITNEN